MDNQNLDLYKIDNKIYFAVTNMQQFKDLIIRANKEAHQLSETVNELNNFNLEIELNIKK